MTYLKFLKKNTFLLLSNKILFGSYKPEQYQDRIVLNIWRKIHGEIHGQIGDTDIAFWASCMVNGPIEHVEEIPGQGNSTVHKIYVSGKKSYGLKHYPDQLMDTRPQLKTEFLALEVLHKYHIKNDPMPIQKNHDLNLGLYEWIDGEKITAPKVDDLPQVINFVENLFAISRESNNNQIGTTSEAYLSADELMNQIDRRFNKQQEMGEDYQELFLFLTEDFEPLWSEVRNGTIPLWPEESLYTKLPRHKQILSPSDFGFHNSLMTINGSLTFIDFDYFDWDDPVKLTADFI